MCHSILQTFVVVTTMCAIIKNKAYASKKCCVKEYLYSIIEEYRDIRHKNYVDLEFRLHFLLHTWKIVASETNYAYILGFASR